MKKALSLIALIFCISYTVSAQSFDKESRVLSIGTGFSADYGLHTSVSYEWGLVDFDEKSSLGISAYLGYAMANKGFEYYGADCGDYCNRDMFIAVGANYHYTAIKKLDLYGGVRIGYDVKFDFIDWEDDTFEFIVGDIYPVSKSKVAYDVHVGARYNLFKGLSFDLEAGYGLSNISGGFSYKF